jgi:hypothetical protein
LKDKRKITSNEIYRSQYLFELFKWLKFFEKNWETIDQHENIFHVCDFEKSDSFKNSTRHLLSIIILFFEYFYSFPLIISEYFKQVKMNNQSIKHVIFDFSNIFNIELFIQKFYEYIFESILFLWLKLHYFWIRNSNLLKLHKTFKIFIRTKIWIKFNYKSTIS